MSNITDPYSNWREGSEEEAIKWLYQGTLCPFIL